MDYSTSYFGKKLTDLTLKDLQIYFQQERIETDQIEFKSISQHGVLNDKIGGIQRSICALLNSSGGIIIWGAPVGIKIPDKKEKVYKGELTYFTDTIEKDFLISKISDSIIPLPINIRVSILSIDGKTIIIFEVDSSEYSPHQTSNTYYMRIDGQSKPAPHHYIDALFKKIKYPIIEAYLKIDRVELYNSDYKIHFTVFFFNWTPLQNEEQLSFRILVHNGVFFKYTNIYLANNYDQDGHELRKENIKSVFHYGEPVYEREIVIFDRNQIHAGQSTLTIIISFGGRFSPMKNSEYTLDFSNSFATNPNDIITSRKENRLSKEVQDEKGMNKELIIENLFKNRS